MSDIAERVEDGDFEVLDEEELAASQADEISELIGEGDYSGAHDKCDEYHFHIEDFEEAMHDYVQGMIDSGDYQTAVDFTRQSGQDLMEFNWP